MDFGTPLLVVCSQLDGIVFAVQKLHQVEEKCSIRLKVVEMVVDPMVYHTQHSVKNKSNSLGLNKILPYFNRTGF